MRLTRIFRLWALFCPLLLASCGDRGDSPTAPASGVSPVALQADLVAQALDPFTFRAPIDPYKIQQLPDFMMQSHTRADVVFQRNVFAPGAGAWHIHPGPSFVYVLQGAIKLVEFSPKKGCTETPVFTAGQAYFEEGNHVHRAVVVSSEDVVLLVTRFNIPVNGAITTPQPDPGC